MCIFFFKQKTAYEMRISDWSSDVCSSDLRDYLTQQFGLLIRNHRVPLIVGPSQTPIPLHFALPEGKHVEGSRVEQVDRPFRDLFDVPDLAITDDAIVNGTHEARLGQPLDRKSTRLNSSH